MVDSVTGTPNPVTEGGVVTFSAALSGGAPDTYKWTVTGGTMTSSDDGATMTATATAAGTPVVGSLTVTNSYGSDNGSDSVTVEPASTPDVTGTITFTPGSVTLPTDTATASVADAAGGSGSGYTFAYSITTTVGSEVIDGTSGVITGIDTAGEIGVTVVITDSDGKDSAPIVGNLTVSAARKAKAKAKA